MDEKETQTVIQRYRLKVESGATPDTIIRALHDEGFWIIESIKLVRGIYSIDLGEAKRLVSNHQVWDKVVEASESLNDALEEVFTESYKDS
jgi:ribosomal protein L7/L12